MNEFSDYLHIMKQNKDKSFVLATVIQVEGSSYRHEGGKMLFGENGERYGLISGGCLEEDLQNKATEVCRTNMGKLLTYDLQKEDDLGWGHGAGCNGKVTIYLEPLMWSMERDQFLSLIHHSLNRGEDIISIRKVMINKTWEPPLLLSEDGTVIGEDKTSFFKQLTIDKPELIQYFLKEGHRFRYMTSIDGERYVLERYKRKDPLYIFGAGVDVEPLVESASQFYFAPIVIDPRESRCNVTNFPNAKKLEVEHPETFLKKHTLAEDSYVIIMTHHFLKDQYLLNYLMENMNTPRPKYVGILGPRQRTERFLLNKKIPDWIHSPVGIEIYAEGAEEISISILGELIKVRNEKEGLRRKKRTQLRANVGSEN